MRAWQWLFAGLAAGCLSTVAGPQGKAAEYTFSTYGLGGAAFGAGVTPPPGTYVSTTSSFYQGRINDAINIGGVVFQGGVKAELFGGAVSGLYVPDWTVLDGHLGLAVTVPAAHVGLEARAQITGPVVDLSATRETNGSGLGDVVTRLQFGWQHGDFAHLFWVQGVAPTGRYEPGFFPIVGLNRPGLDTGWAFTWEDKSTKLQFNGAVGFNFNFGTTGPTTSPATRSTSSGPSGTSCQRGW